MRNSEILITVIGNQLSILYQVSLLTSNEFKALRIMLRIHLNTPENTYYNYLGGINRIYVFLLLLIVVTIVLKLIISSDA